MTRPDPTVLRVCTKYARRTKWRNAALAAFVYVAGVALPAVAMWMRGW